MTSERIKKTLRKYPFMIVGALASFCIFGATIYRHGEITRIAQSLSENQEKIDQIRRNNRFAITLGDDLAKLDSYLERIDKGLVDPDAKAANLAYFYELGNYCGVPVKRADQRLRSDQARMDKKGKPIASKKSFQNVTFEIGVEGDFASLVRFIDRLKNDRFLVRYDAIRIRQGEVLEGRVVAADITLSTISKVPEVKK